MIYLFIDRVQRTVGNLHHTRPLLQRNLREDLVYLVLTVSALCVRVGVPLRDHDLEVLLNSLRRAGQLHL